jgi:hypothetical protein
VRTTDLLKKELELEAFYTRRHLERVPMDTLDFKPHEKSMTLGWLATFTAILPSWGSLTLSKNECSPGGLQRLGRREGRNVHGGLTSAQPLRGRYHGVVAA